jgi:glycosyltransferase involved in cell wall biosynthesis
LNRSIDEGGRVIADRSDADASAVQADEAEALRDALRDRDLALTRLKLENRRLEDALRAISTSRWSMLGELLRRRPFGLADMAQVGRLGAGLLRTRLRPAKPAAESPAPMPVPPPVAAAGSVPEAAPAASESVPAPYVVKVPAPTQAAQVRVVHVIANFMTGGSSRLVVDLVEHLGGQYRQAVLTSFVPTPPAYTGLDITVLPVHASDKAFSDYFARIQPDLVHIHYWGDTDEPWYRRAFDAIDDKPYPVIENVNTPVAPYLSPRVARYVYVSSFVKAQFGGSAANEEVIYPGSNFSMFAPRATRSDDGNTIGMVYRLERDKLDENSIDPIIEAVRRRPGSHALIVGGGSLLPGYRRKVDAAGLNDAFQFTGYVAYEDLPALYERMTLFVAPVWKESFGQVSAFAMNMGVPVVGYDIGAIAEIIDDNSLVAAFPDAGALADIIVRLLDEPARQAAVGRRNRDRARAAFAVEAMVERYAGLYGDLTARRA